MEEQNKDVCPECGIKHDPETEELTHIADMFTKQIVDEAFSIVWKDARKMFKELNKSELAKEMFYIGGVQILGAYLNRMNEFAKKELSKKEGI